MTEANKKALLVAFYLSKFDRRGISILGYKTLNEAFKGIGASLGVKPATVKNMRDSFDPYCSHIRAGWYQREILPSRANVIAAYNEVSEEAMAEIVSAILSGGDMSSQAYIIPIVQISDGAALLAEDTPYAQRIRTGEEAENHFITEFPTLELFQGSKLEDMRKIGIGFDFRTSFSESYYAVEVKGLRGEHGSISFTDKEWSVASILRDNYFLALVRDLDKKPSLEVLADPVSCIEVKMKSFEAVSIYWSAKV